MRRAWVIAAKDLRLLVRDPMALFWAVGFPVLFALFIGSVLSLSLGLDRARVRVGFVDEAHDESSRLVRARLAADPKLELSEGTLDAARTAVRRGELAAAVRTSGGAVELWVDPSRSTETRLVEAALGAAFVPPQEIPVRSVIRSADAPSAFALVFPAAIAWGLMGCAATFAVSLVAERTGGTLIRVRAAPLSGSTLVAGKALACALACFFDAALLLAVARVGFGVKIAQPLSVGLAIGALTLCFVGLTLLLSTLGKSEQAVSGAGWATLLFLAMIGGAMVPVSLMPGWMQGLSVISPVRWGVLALEGALWRGFGPRELLPSLAVLVAVGCAAGTLGHAVLRRRAA